MVYRQVKVRLHPAALHSKLSDEDIGDLTLRRLRDLQKRVDFIAVSLRTYDPAEPPWVRVRLGHRLQSPQRFVVALKATTAQRHAPAEDRRAGHPFKRWSISMMCEATPNSLSNAMKRKAKKTANEPQANRLSDSSARVMSSIRRFVDHRDRRRLER